jgi:hypothetical protein
MVITRGGALALFSMAATQRSEVIKMSFRMLERVREDAQVTLARVQTKSVGKIKTEGVANLPANTMIYMQGTRLVAAPRFPPTLDDLFKLNNPMTFQDYLRRPSNEAHLDKLARDFEQFGLEKGYFQKIVDSTKRTYQVAKNAEEKQDSTMGGKMASVTAHPVFAGSAAILASMAVLSLGPMYVAGTFVLTLLVAAQAADLADLARAAVEMRKMGGAPPVRGLFTTVALTAEGEDRPAREAGNTARIKWSEDTIALKIIKCTGIVCFWVFISIGIDRSLASICGILALFFAVFYLLSGD